MPNHPNTRLTNRDYFADILVNRKHNPAIFYWIAQRFGSADIVSMGSAFTFEDAEREAHHCLDRLAKAQSCDEETPFDKPFREA
jgi:hypothetical protein